MFESLLPEVAHRLDQTLAAVWLRHGERETLRCVHAWAASPDDHASFWAATKNFEMPDGVGIVGRVFAHREAELVPDLARDGRFLRGDVLVDGLGLRSGVFVPLVSGERVTGVIEFFSRNGGHVDGDLLACLHDIGTQVGQFVERRRAEQATRVAKKQLETANTELARSNDQLQTQNERLQELDRLKDTLIATVSHELRTPLTSIRGYAELLLEREVGELTPEQEKFLRVIDRNTGRLLRVVGDLLFLARLEEGKLTLEVAPLDLGDVVRECLASAEPNADGKGIELRLDDEELPPIVGDRIRLAQVFDNLLSNAVKFTPDGGRVDVRLRGGAGAVLAEVADTGIGIPPSERDKVFDRFFRTDGAVKEAIQGTGLGLAITKAIAEAHGGTIFVADRNGEGTTFRVELPLNGDHALAPQADEHRNAA